MGEPADTSPEIPAGDATAAPVAVGADAPQDVDLEALNAEATAAAVNEEFARALTLFEDLRARDPDNATAAYGVAFSLRKLGRRDEAEKAVTDGLLVHPYSANLFNERGLLAYERSDYDAAIAAFDQALALDPGSVTAWPWKVTALRVTGDYDTADRALDDAIAAIGETASLAGERGLIAYNRSQYDAAIAAFDRALAVDPTSEFAWQ